MSIFASILLEVTIHAPSTTVAHRSIPNQILNAIDRGLSGDLTYSPIHSKETGPRESGRHKESREKVRERVATRQHDTTCILFRWYDMFNLQPMIARAVQLDRWRKDARWQVRPCYIF